MKCHIYAFEKLYKKEPKLQRYLDAPLLHEREAYITHMEGKGYCLRYLLIKATYLLYAVNNLPPVGGELIPLESIALIQDSYRWKSIR